MSTQTATATKPQASPAVQGGIVAYLAVEGAAAASEFYQRAFGAQEVARMPGAEDGRLIHCHLYINGASLMLSDPFPEQGHPHVPAAGYSLMLPVDDIDVRYRRAVEAGCEAVMPPADMFWGDRYGQLRDPFGVLWAMNQGAA